MYFDPQYYLNTNPDVASVYGKTNYAGAYNHFVAFGFAEGRQGSPVFSVRQYVNQYSDLKKAFGTNWLAAAWHFRNNGIAEGRQSSVSFSVTDYANLNSDVKKAFSTNRDYIIHYLQFGKNKEEQPSPRVRHPAHLRLQDRRRTIPEPGASKPPATTSSTCSTPPPYPIRRRW